MNICEFIKEAISLDVSDLHLTAGQQVFYRKDGDLISASNKKVLSVNDVNELLEVLLLSIDKIKDRRELDFSWKFDKRRFRVNVYKQREQSAIAMRLIADKIPTLSEIGAPQILSTLINSTQGMLLVTGRTGSGKTTTLAAFINEICKNRPCHILTLEDPIEYEYQSDTCFISQRELGTDFSTFPQALKSALREMPDVLLVGEIRDKETMAMAMEAASAGIFVLSTLHTKSATETAMRVESMFSVDQRESVREQFADVFTGICSQQLVKKISGGRVSATEVLLSTSASKNLIRQGKYMQLASTMMSSKNLGMQTMEMALQKLIDKKLITAV